MFQEPRWIDEPQGTHHKDPRTITHSSLQPQGEGGEEGGNFVLTKRWTRHFEAVIRPLQTPPGISSLYKSWLLKWRFATVEFREEHQISKNSPVNMDGIFLDNVAELAGAHHASSARTSLHCYISELSPSRHLHLSLWGQNWVCLTESPSPKSTYRDGTDQLFSTFAPFLSFFLSTSC